MESHRRESLVKVGGVDKKKVLITGACGFLGQHLVRRFARHWRVVGGCYRYFALPASAIAVALDLRDERHIAAVVGRERPDVIVHAAALSRPIECERFPGMAWQINAKGTAALACAASKIAARFVYISTDLVFDGESGNYNEGALAVPRNVYGTTKLDGERSALQASPNCSIIRLSLLYGMGDDLHKSASDVVVASLLKDQTTELFTDEYRTPLNVLDAVDAIYEIVVARKDSRIFHLGGPERLSRYELGLRISQALGLSPRHLKGICLSASRAGKDRPRDCSLNSTKSWNCLCQSPSPALSDSERFLAALWPIVRDRPSALLE